MGAQIQERVPVPRGAALFGTLACLACASASPTSVASVASVLLDTDGNWLVQQGMVKGAVAVGAFNDSVDATGWASLNIESSRQYNATAQAYAAGYVEGYLTQARIFQVTAVVTHSVLLLLFSEGKRCCGTGAGAV